MAKYWVTDIQGEVIDEMLQLHGGYGYMNEYPIAQPVQGLPASSASMAAPTRS
jgi:alkylation response protein AidB-like acyl-CoA dehydrogenase